jgi:acetyl esterase/lipase
MENQRIAIWRNYHYAGEDTDGFQPTLTTYILDSERPRPAVLICPGGGYRYVSSREGEPVALQFNAAGFHALVLNYSVAPRRYPQPVLDLARAMCLIREKAGTWWIDPNKIAVCGFSAGGHLAACLAVHGDKSYLKGVPGITGESLCPNALILGYPVISAGCFAHHGSVAELLGDDPDKRLQQELSLELHVSETTPPVFLWHTFADQTVPLENTLLFAQALRNKKVPFELHIFPNGPHGLSLATRETSKANVGVYPHVAQWLGLCTEWLEETLGA